MTPIDEALERFATRGPEFRGGLSNHGPMAADALIAMNRPDAVLPWAERYATRLEERPRPLTRIQPDDWREALGDYRRLADWERFFKEELAARPWADVLSMWTARLAPGFLASATHGLLRTAHAVRGLSSAETEPRLTELGRGLAYWAARYFALPESPSPHSLALGEALAAVPVVPVSERKPGFLITQVVGQLADREEFAPVVNTLDTSGDVSVLLSDFTAVFARLYLENADRVPIAWVHSVTGPSAIRLLAPHVPGAVTRDLVRYGWQAGAAFIAMYSGDGPAAPAASDPGTEDDLIDRAVASGDEHAIKFTDACLREHRLKPNPAYLAAAADVSARLKA